MFDLTCVYICGGASWVSNTTRNDCCFYRRSQERYPLSQLAPHLDVNLVSFNFRRNFVTILHVYHNVSLCFNQNPIIIIMFYDGDDDDDDYDDDDDDDDDDDGSMRYLVRHCEPAKTNIMLFHSSSGVQLMSR